MDQNQDQPSASCRCACGAELKPGADKCWLCNSVAKNDTLSAVNESFTDPSEATGTAKRAGWVNALILFVFGIVALGAIPITAGLSLIAYLALFTFVFVESKKRAYTFGYVVYSILLGILTLFAIVVSIILLLFLICLIDDKGFSVR